MQTLVVRPKKISIVIPVFNESKTINAVIDKVMSLKLKKARILEVVVIDDNSTDGTRKILKQIEKRYEIVNCYYKNKNEGKGSALKLGFKKTLGDIVIIQDADLEYSPDEYQTLIQPFIDYNADVVYGSRFNIYRPHRVMYYWHYVTNRFLTSFSNMLTNLNLTDMETGYKCFRGDLIRKITPTLKSKRFGFEPEITAKISKVKNIQIYEVGISYQGRTYNEGKKINWMDGIKAIFEIVRFNFLD